MHSLVLATLVSATSIVAGCASDHHIHDAEPAKPEHSAHDAKPVLSEAEMMAKLQELAKPGAPHEALAKLVGSWEQSYRMRWSLDAEWQDTTGKSEAKLLLGGRYLLEELQFEMMGMPIQGLHLLGYDNVQQEYISLWADSLSTWWITARGKEGPDGTVSLKGTMTDVTGTRPFRMVVRHMADGTKESEMYDTVAPHGEIKVMTIKAKRR